MTQRGSMLVITLWLIAVLSMVAIALSRFLSTETRLLRYHGARAQAQAWAIAGVRLAIQRLQEDTNAYDALGERWALPSPEDPEDPTVWVVSMPMNGTISITITDEERKLDINNAPEDALTRLVGNPAVAQAIVSYRDPGADGEYEGDPTHQPPYLPKNSPLSVVEELWELPTIQEDAAASARLDASATVFVEPLAVNINTASAEVLKALVPTVAPTIIDQVVAARPGPNGRLGDEDDCTATDSQNGAIQLAGCAGIAPAEMVTLLAPPRTVSSSVFRVVATGMVEKPAVRARVEAVVKRVQGGEPVILAWMER